MALAPCHGLHRLAIAGPGGFAPEPARPSLADRLAGASSRSRRRPRTIGALVRWIARALPAKPGARPATNAGDAHTEHAHTEHAHTEDAHTESTRPVASEAASRRPLTAAEAARFRTTLLPHLDAAYTLARYLARDADAAADIVQEAYLRAYRAFPDFRGLSARAWLLAIVRNCHHSWHGLARRERQRRAPEPSPADGEDDATSALDLLADAETPESILLRQAEAAAVRALLQRLPEPLREVLVLRELEELSYREIAEVAGVPVGTVMSRLARARRLFAELWEQGPHREEAP